MKIFYPNASIHYPPADGPHVHQLQLIKHLTELGHEVTTLEPDMNPHTTTLSKRPLSVLGAVRGADVIYCRTNEGLNAATRLTAPGLRAIIPRRCAVVWQMDLSLDLIVSPTQRTPARVERDTRRLCGRARRVDAAIGVTRLIADQAKNTLGIEHAYTIQNGSDPRLFTPDATPAKGLRRGSPRLNVGWIGSHTNTIHDAALIEQLCILIDLRQLPIDVHAIGRTEGMFATPRPRSLTLHGPVPYFELPGYLAGMDVGLALYNLRYDGGSPLKLFDYMASGCVAVCSSSQPMEEVLACKDAGFIDGWSAESLADQLMRLHDDHELLRRTARNGRALIESKHNWATIAKETAGILQDAHARRGRTQ